MSSATLSVEPLCFKQCPQDRDVPVFGIYIKLMSDDPEIHLEYSIAKPGVLAEIREFIFSRHPLIGGADNHIYHLELAEAPLMLRAGDRLRRIRGGGAEYLIAGLAKVVGYDDCAARAIALSFLTDHALKYGMGTTTSPIADPPLSNPAESAPTTTETRPQKALANKPTPWKK